MVLNAEKILIDEEDALALRNNTKLTKILPRQWPSKKTKENIESASRVLSGGTSAIFAGNVLISLPMSVSLQYLWEMINAQ